MELLEPDEALFLLGLCVGLLGSIAALLLGLAGIINDPGSVALASSISAVYLMVAGIGLKTIFGK